MTDLRIAFFGVKSWERAAIEKEIIRLPAYGVGIFEGEVQNNMALAKKYEIISPFVYSDLSCTVLEELPNLRMIATRSTGVDHIDGELCKERKIVVANVPTYGSHTVAEYTMALLLAIAKKICVAHQSIDDGEFSPEGLTGVDIYGKTLGVVGVGKIGANVIRIARAMGMKIVATEKNKDEALAKKLKFKYADLETLLKESDFVTMHVPYTADTFHLLNRKNIKLMKKGSYLINTSRGPVVETEAVVWGLNNKTLVGAAMDVVEEETMLESVSTVINNKANKEDLKEVLSFHLLRDRDDVIFTPHNAFNTHEAIGRIVSTTVDNILAFLREESK